MTDLSGVWEFLPGPADLADLPDELPRRISVPGLWEAQGYPRLDGEAWYRTWFDVPADATGDYWRLEFGAVMDAAEVYVNGQPVGAHDLAYTPFDCEIGPAVRAGRNRLDVRVVDHPLGGRAHTRTAHGKQGWMNGVFPSPPSLYGTYGGIWQPVVLRRHAAVTVERVHVTTDLDTVTVAVRLRNDSPRPVTVTVHTGLLGAATSRVVTAGPGTTDIVPHTVGAAGAARWTPATPVLHTARVCVDDADTREVRFGIRTFDVDRDRFRLNGEPVVIHAALVQGFRADTLYAEGNRAQIEAEVGAARDAGFNTLRLHIKAFDPVYLDVCDELGMLVHADIPVAEPIAHDELDATGPLADHCAAAVRAQIERDRNHPCVVLWSLMNELCAEHPPTRRTAGYEGFVRRLYQTATEADPWRPVIENDWIEPDPDEIFHSPIMTAHWYGRLSSGYLRQLRERITIWAGTGRPFYLSEFGDWGLPQPAGDDPPWWSADPDIAAAVGALPWAGSVTDFTGQTQHYQGVSDRLQIEVIREAGLPGWCVTELTDVPHEYNGLWTVDRRPKLPAIAQLRLATQDVLPMCPRSSWSVPAGRRVELPVRVSNERPAAVTGTLTVTLDGEAVGTWPVDVPAHALGAVPAALVAPSRPGDHALTLAVSGPDGAPVGHNAYTLHVFGGAGAVPEVDVIGTATTHALLAAAGARVRPGARLLVVGEGCLDARAGAALAAGRDVLVLRQPVDAARHLPVPGTAVDVATAWGSTPFLFTGPTTLPGLPPTTVLTTHLMATAVDVVWSSLDAPRTLVGLWKPAPGPVSGMVVGRVDRLWLCQLGLEAADDPDAAAALLAGLLVLGAATG